MKLQIQGDTLRFRIDEAELAHLLAGELLHNSTQIAVDRYFSQSLGVHAGAEPLLQVSPETWQVLLPRDRVRDYIARLPCRDALAFELPVADAVALMLQFEVDVRDSLQVRGPRRRGESPQSQSASRATKDA